jgi:hypothetical protein
MHTHNNMYAEQVGRRDLHPSSPYCPKNVKAGVYPNMTPAPIAVLTVRLV